MGIMGEESSFISRSPREHKTQYLISVVGKYFFPNLQGHIKLCSFCNERGFQFSSFNWAVYDLSQEGMGLF